MESKKVVVSICGGWAWTVKAKAAQEALRGIGLNQNQIILERARSRVVEVFIQEQSGRKLIFHKEGPNISARELCEAVRACLG